MFERIGDDRNLRGIARDGTCFGTRRSFETLHTLRVKRTKRDDPLETKRRRTTEGSLASPLLHCRYRER